MNYLITNGYLLLEDGDGFRAEKQDLFVMDGKIAAIGRAPETEETFTRIDARDRLVMPGLINMHTHVYMTGMRNYADDVPFGEWLFDRVMPVEDTLTAEAAYWCNLLGMIEMIRTGTTTFVDMHMFHEQSCLAAEKAGLRGYIGRGLVGGSLYEAGNRRFPEALEEMEKHRSDTLDFILSPHAIYSCSVDLMKEVVRESDARGLLRQTHLSEGMTEVENCLKEHGKTPVALLDDIGFLSSRTILAHCVQMQNDDIARLARSGATVVTNPASNAKLSNGFAPVLEMQAAGVNICLGTDGAASNNTLNLFREMGLFTMIHKGISRDSTAAPAAFTLKTCTSNAARALGRAGELGVIAEGAAADLIFLDLNAVSLFPNNNIVSSLCYSANGSEVTDTMVNGRFLMRDRTLLTIDEAEVFAHVRAFQQKFLQISLS